MFEQFKTKFRVLRDPQGDPYIPLHGHEGFLARDAMNFAYEAGPQTIGLWLSTNRPNQTYKAIRSRWPEVQLAQVGDGECIVLFPFTDRRQAIKFLRSVHAHKRVEKSPEQIAAEVERLKLINASRRLAAGVPESTNAPQSDPR